MRNLFVLLALLGLAGIVLGVLAMVHGAAGPHGIPFRFENYGGPGSIIAGLIMLAASLYLRSAWPDRR
jgi:formate hydrogenlyase subunit 3/multisubunit Na+/H+ antiporter MnhD subunit